jgi:hypothetical protein
MAKQTNNRTWRGRRKGKKKKKTEKWNEIFKENQ